MDVPDFFPDEEPPQLPQDQRSRVAVASRTPPASDLNLKAGVQLNLGPQMAGALRVISARGDVITSGSEGYSGDGVHKPNSLHYDGAALDIRPARDRVRQAQRYRDEGYNVLDKPDHLHVSRDPAGIRV
jgi:hypothetical protein